MLFIPSFVVIIVVFVRDGIISVADFNSSWMGVVGVVVVVVVGGKAIFTMGYHENALSYKVDFFAWYFVMTICFDSEFGS